MSYFQKGKFYIRCRLESRLDGNEEGVGEHHVCPQAEGAHS